MRTVRGFALTLTVLVAMAAATSVSADSQFMEVPGCVGSGSSTLYSDTSALGLSDGCSGSDTLIASTVYVSGGGQYQCPWNWTWGSGDTYCVYSPGVASIYGAHRMRYTGNYSNYVYTSD